MMLGTRWIDEPE
jgi:hypothetical protein